MTNRLLQHLHAITTPSRLPDVPQPEPPRGHSHFTTATFAPDAIGEGWSPRHAEDAPTTLRYEDVSFQGRYACLKEALRWMFAFNRLQFAGIKFLSRPTEWATLAYVEGAYESVNIGFARCVTPLRYFTHEVMATPRWRPANLLDAPAENWSDEFCGLSKHAHDTLEKAVSAAIKANRKFRPGMRKKSGWPQRWTVILAVEADAMHQFDALHCVGKSGNLTVMEQRRFHLVDATWPIAQTADVVKGGADHE